MAEAALYWRRTVALLKTGALHNRWVQAIAIGISLFIVYWLTSPAGNAFNQYVLLADAFLHGRLYLVDPPLHLELAKYGTEAFVIDPPAPALFLMPFVAIWGTGINQILVSMGVGAAAMGLFWVATRQMGWDLQLSVAMTMLLALGTNFWWASTDGGLWAYANVSAVFFLMAALVEATGSKRPWLVGLLVGLAGLSRLPTFLTFPFFAYLVIRGAERPLLDVIKDRGNWLRIGLFGMGLGVMAAAYLAYNYERYGTVLDKGYDHPSYAKEPWFSEGRFDISYIPRHIEAILFKQPVPTADGGYPFFRPSMFGMGLFFTTPAFLYIFNTHINRFTLAAIIATLITLVPLTLHGTTGWSQFGYRYSMDLFPMLAVLTAAGMRHQMTPLKWGAVILSCFIGAWFYEYGWAD